MQVNAMTADATSAMTMLMNFAEWLPLLMVSPSLLAVMRYSPDGHR